MAMTGWAEPSSHRFCSRDPPSTATGGADPATLPLPHGYRPLFGPLSRGSTVGGDGRGRSGDLFPSRTCPVFSPPASRADPSPATTRGLDPATSSPPATADLIVKLEYNHSNGSYPIKALELHGSRDESNVSSSSPSSSSPDHQGIPAKFIQGY
uniref:Uncharacterized protein n=1 Tax=Oryza glumipatula TaxID=40148 RepID=A0A0D9ZMK2_9ORYZ